VKAYNKLFVIMSNMKTIIYKVTIQIVHSPSIVTTFNPVYALEFVMRA